MIALGACTNENYAIDEFYLKSDKYKSFERKFRTEAKLKENQERSFAAHLKELGNCKEGLAGVLLLLNRDVIKELAQRSPENCKQLVTAEEFNFKFHLLGETHNENFSIKWVLLEQESVYINWQLYAVQFKDGELVDFAKVAVFQKNITEDIDSEVKVTKHGQAFLLYTKVDRKIIYPIEQSNIIIQRFIISKKGIENSE